ncbi:MAG: hypothetical protein HY456_00725 [Parcubacteria group bacterium]|nr:hypothetical protein [Parcubacteria group bacterium]
MEIIAYSTLSIFVVVLSVMAVFIAKRAMSRGLTYSSMASVVWVLAILAIGRAWHTFYELTRLKTTMGEAPEMIEYLIYIAAYIVFLWLAARTSKLKSL